MEFRGNPEHLAILEQGVEAWNKWRDENPLDWPDLRGANLFMARLARSDLKGANLCDAFLQEVRLSEADIFRC